MTLTKTTPWPHQVDAFNAVAERPGAMLAIPMGGGKGLAAIALAENYVAARVLVVCPKSVVDVWRPEFETHAVRDYRIWDGAVIGASGKQLKNPAIIKRADAMRASGRASGDRPFVAVTNFESLLSDAMNGAIRQTSFDLLIIDESHRIKSPGGKASKRLGDIGRRVRAIEGHVLLLTGTPMPHSPLDLYAQYRAADPSIFGSSNQTFKMRYAGRKVMYVANGGEPVWEEAPDGTAIRRVGVDPPKTPPLRRAKPGEPVYAVGPKGEALYDGLSDLRRDEFERLAGSIMFRMDQDELDKLLGLPPTVDVYRTCELEPVTRKLYDELHDDMVAQVEGGYVTAANAMVLVLRLAQVVSGCAPIVTLDDPFYMSDPIGPSSEPVLSVALLAQPEKAALLKDILSDLPEDEPVVVFARFRHDLDSIRRVAEDLGRTYGELSGRRRDGLAGPKMNPDITILGCQLRSGGVGIDLTRARYGVYYSLDFSLADHQQSRKRLHRPGQTRRTTYIHLLAADTVDESIYWALRHRAEVIDAILDRMKGTK